MPKAPAMGIVYACVSPHPPIIVPEVGRGREREVRRTLDALAQVAAEMASHRPELAVLAAVHGPLHPASFTLLDADRAEGDFAQWGAPQVQLSFPVDREAVEAVREEAAARGLPLRTVSRWDLDWSVTVPLYYLRSGLEGARLVLLNISFLPPRDHFRLGQAVRAAVERLGRRTVVIASADLSHRLSPEGPYGFDPAGPELDRCLEEAVARWDVEAVLSLPLEFRERAGDDAVPSLSFLMGALDGLAVQPRVLSHEGPWGVGYMVAAVDVLGRREGLEDGLPRTAVRAPAHPLVRLAKEAVEAYVREGKAIQPSLPPEALAGLPQRAGVFVSIKTADGRLRGCIGSVYPTRPTLAEEVVAYAIESATNDHRFPPVAPEELDGLVYSVDVLSPPEPVSGPEALDPKRYGVIVRKGLQRGLLLPDIEGVETVDQQLSIAKAKAGLDPDEEGVEIYRFTVQRLT
ncbi:MAG TPA: AmmeMemoRadiSam system protein A [Dehalococcoidia bacterium]|nr:AmmeMemoRadiSam system protein A [Dehalococcoidia bacterium]